MTVDTRPPLDLDPDAPHDPQRTAQLAALASAAVRILNYATLPGRGGLAYPGDAYDLLATLGELAGRLPQLCGQSAAWLSGELAAGHLAEIPGGRYGGDADRAVTAAGSALTEAARTASRLADVLREAHAALGGLEHAEPRVDDQDDDPHGYNEAGPHERAAWAAEDQADDEHAAWIEGEQSAGRLLPDPDTAAEEMAERYADEESGGMPGLLTGIRSTHATVDDETDAYFADYTRGDDDPKLHP